MLPLNDVPGPLVDPYAVPSGATTCLCLWEQSIEQVGASQCGAKTLNVATMLKINQ